MNDAMKNRVRNPQDANGLLDKTGVAGKQIKSPFPSQSLLCIGEAGHSARACLEIVAAQRWSSARPLARSAQKHLIVGKRHPAAAAVPNQLFSRGR
jgi:hypothetical protein